MSTNEETGLIAVDDKKKFRIQSSRVFITFPQCETTPEDAAKKIDESPKTQSCRYVIAQENHKDGHKHLHLYIEKPKGFNFHDANYFDFITGKHGNIQKVKCREAVLAYVTKENRWISHEIDVSEILKTWAEKKENKKKPKMTRVIADMIAEGKSYEDLLENQEITPFMVLHSQQVQKYFSEQGIVQEKKKRKLNKPSYLHIVLNCMEYDLLANMPFKTPQFWIYGPPNTGKSTFIMKLQEAGLNGFEIPINNDFANWSDELYDFAYIDEFKGQLTIQFLNLFLQGGTMTLPGKYVAGGRIKRKNLPIFILSNYTPEHVYHKKSVFDLEPLLCRLRIIHLNSFNDYEIRTQAPSPPTPLLSQTPLLDASPDIGIADLYSNEQIVD